MSQRWNTEPLKAYENIQINGKIYLDSIQNKLNLICLARDRIQDYFFVENLQDFQRKRLLLTIDLEAILYNLNSISDILACIINHWIIFPTTNHIGVNSNSLTIRQEQRTLYNVENVLKKLKNRFSLPKTDPNHLNIDTQLQTILSECLNLVTNLIQSAHFKYVRDFVNTVKHSQTIDSTWTMDIDANCDWKINPFDVYDPLSVNEFINDYHPDVFDQFMIIGNKVNDFCNCRQSLGW